MTPFSITFPITPAKWQAIRHAFEEKGIEVADAPSGSISQDGVAADFTQDGTTLTITVTDKPWYASQNRVIDGLTEFINDA